MTKRAKAQSSVARPTAAPPTPATTYMLRTCNADMTSYNGFVWPESGEVTCPDWKKRAECGNGLHGLLHGEGDHSLLSWDESAKWLVVEVNADDVVDIRQKVKVPRATVVFCGARAAAIAKLLELDPLAKSERVPCGQASASGYQGQASASGYHGQASASGYQGQASASGDYGQASASGHQGQASASGQRGQASASGYQGQASASGYQGQASASGDYGQASASGYRGQASAYRGRAKAGDKGILILFRWDAAAQRDRVVVGYVGENGVEPNAFYKLDATGAIVPAPDDLDYREFTAETCAKDARELQLELVFRS